MRLGNWKGNRNSLIHDFKTVYFHPGQDNDFHRPFQNPITGKRKSETESTISVKTFRERDHN
jgi:hypothetical protein